MGRPLSRPKPDAEESQRQQLRGSSLLLVGRVLAVGVNFITQVVIVRSLSKGDFGVFAYALSVVNLAESAVTLGLDRGVTRFLPIYDERNERGRFVGTLLFVPAAVTALGVVVVGFVVLLRTPIASAVVGSGSAALTTATTVVVLLAFLAPIQALDNLLLGLFAVFSKARAIFFRRYVLAPALRLLVVVVLATADRDVRFLAGGYALAGAAGVALYVVFLVRTLRRSGALDTHGAPLEVPYRELLAFTIPLLTTDLVFVLLESTDALLLGALKGPAEVASLRAVQPAARVNQLVLASFGVLFTPLAARHFARNEVQAVRDLYWRTATWVAVASFPLAALTVAAAAPLTVALFGNRYEDSGPLLGVLSAGYYLNAALGFNGLTLNVFGRVRAVVVVNLSAAALNVVLNVALVPSFGAMGAAIATASTLVLHNVLRQVALQRQTPVPAFDQAYARSYVAVVLGLATAAAICILTDAALVPAVAVCAAVSLAVLAVSRRDLRIGDAFPELARLPVVGRLVQ